MHNMGCCGADCDACKARKATSAGDLKELAQIAADNERGGFILPSRLRCTGCLKPGAKSVICMECRIRMCAMERGVPHCGFCGEFPCLLGNPLWEAIPEYKHNIERIMSR